MTIRTCDCCKKGFTPVGAQDYRATICGVCVESGRHLRSMTKSAREEMLSSHACKIKKLKKKNKSLQAKIDGLMFEYCPEDMTNEQIKNWEKHQVVVK